LWGRYDAWTIKNNEDVTCRKNRRLLSDSYRRGEGGSTIKMGTAMGRVVKKRRKKVIKTDGLQKGVGKNCVKSSNGGNKSTGYPTRRDLGVPSQSAVNTKKKNIQPYEGNN